MAMNSADYIRIMPITICLASVIH